MKLFHTKVNLKPTPNKSSDRKSYIITFILILFTLIPNIYLAAKGVDFEGASLTKRIAFFILSFNLLVGFLVFLRPRIFFIFTILFISFIPVEIFIIHQYHCSINPGILFSILNSNIHEATEIFNSIILFVIGSIVFNGIYIYLVYRFIPFRFKIHKKIRIIIGIAFCIVLFTMWLREIKISFSIYPTSTKKEGINHGSQTFLLKFAKIFPYNYIVNARNLIVSQLDIRQNKKNVQNFKFYAVKKDTLSINETYVLIIGEASRRHNYQLYNYERQTNPYLSKQKNLIVYSDYISTGNLTFFCIPMIMTRATPIDFTISYKEKSFISAFKEAGFKTFWISNIALFNSDHARITTEADNIYDLNSNANNSNNFDENLLPYLDAVLREKNQKKLIIINLMGSHFRYNYRYPGSFNIFKPGLDGAFAYNLLKPENKDRFTNIYDNSVLYTDYILHLIFKKIEDEKGIGLAAYLSDHGENLFDDANGFFTHGLQIPTKYEVEVPLLVWYSDLYSSTYREKLKNLQNNKDRSASTENIFYSMLDAANIYYNRENLNKSFFSSDFNESPERLILNPKFEVFSYKDSGAIVKKE